MREFYLNWRLNEVHVDSMQTKRQIEAVSIVDFFDLVQTTDADLSIRACYVGSNCVDWLTFHFSCDHVLEYPEEAK